MQALTTVCRAPAALHALQAGASQGRCAMQRSRVYHWELLDFATHFGIRAEELQVRKEHQSETRGSLGVTP